MDVFDVTDADIEAVATRKLSSGEQWSFDMDPAYYVLNCFYDPRERAAKLATPSWWTSSLDELVASSINEFGWAWEWNIDKRLRIMVEAMASGKNWLARRDRHALTNLARTRASALDMFDGMLMPQWETCSACGFEFHQQRVHPDIVSKFGAANVHMCEECCRSAFWSFRPTTRGTKPAALAQVRDLARLCGGVPAQNFAVGPELLRSLSRDDQVELVALMRVMPDSDYYIGAFGSWFEALIASGVLAEGSQRMQRGTRCVARDGHLCSSIGEKTICDLLFELGIEHEREPHYPGSKLRADFRLPNGTLVEYLGLYGDAKYDAKTMRKRLLARELGLDLVLIYPRMLQDRVTLGELLLERSDRASPAAA